MAKKSKKSPIPAATQTEPVIVESKDGKGTTLDVSPGVWQGDPEKGADKETQEHKDARAILGR